MTVPAVEPYADAPVDPNSSAAAAIQAQASQPATFPTFEGIPETPTDLRTAEGWRMAVSEVEGDGVGLLNATAPSTWSLNDTEGFAARMQSLIDFDPADVPSAGQAAETEAWAARMRARATPPPRPR
ncbi:MAG TPA: hypothetical protein VF122_01060 [Caulobacteraceae bacterium]